MLKTHRLSSREASSYDYSSPVSENRVIGSKYYETKLLTLFTRGTYLLFSGSFHRVDALWQSHSNATAAARDLPKTDMIGNVRTVSPLVPNFFSSLTTSVQGTSYTDNAAITTSELRNPDTNAGFYVTLHAYSPSDTLETFKLNVNTSEGLCEYESVPRVQQSPCLTEHSCNPAVRRVDHDQRPPGQSARHGLQLRV